MKAPRAPDPFATAAAQQQMNTQTAQQQQALNMVNQQTPDGSLTYQRNYNVSDALAPGAYTAVTSLSPEQQALKNQEQQFDRKFNEIGLAQTDRIGSVLSQPVNLNNEATEGRLMELGRKRLDPVFAERNQQLEQDLMNRGIRPGSAAYDTLRRQASEAQNDAYNQLLLTGRQQAVQEALTERNQPINEISALLNGGQVSLPQFTNTPQTNVANTDLAGLIMDNYKNKQANYQAGMGGLFGLGSALIGGGARMFTGGFGR